MKTTFAPGTKVTSAWLNAIQSTSFDDQDLDGHLPRITDEMLSNAAGDLKTVWANFNTQFLVKAATGLSVTINGGTFTNSQDLAVTLSPSGITVPASATTYIWVTDAGAFASGSSLPVIALPIAAVTTSPSAILSILDLRPRFKVSPQSRSIAVWGGRSTNDLVYSSSMNVEGVINCRNLTINAGVTLNVPTGYLKIVASGTVTIAGTVNVVAPIQGGFFYGGEIFGPVQIPAESGKGFGGGAGHNGPGGQTYPYEASIFGSGGASGLVATTLTGQVSLVSSRGGAGGGAFAVEAAGDITVSGAINCNGGNAAFGGVVTLTSGHVWITGGGGGSGGSIALRSLSRTIVTAAGSLSVRGGNGANAVLTAANSLAVGGGGGGGGRVFLASPATNITGATITLTAGTGGANAGTASSGVNGSPGGGYGGGGGGSTGGAGSIGQLTLQSFITV
jgi:hypothetical protein